MSKSSEKNGFIIQAGILAAAGIICRIIGLLYRSPLAAVIGDEGNGYYQTAFNIYTMILLISSYSIPSAISKVIAQKLSVHQYKNAHRIFTCAIWYVLVVGGLASLVLFFGAGFLTKGPAVFVVRFFAPTIFLYGLLGVLRGYFQAHRSMVQTSVSQIIEQILNALVSIGAALLFTSFVAGEAAGNTTKRALYGAVGSALGTGSGVLIALLFMWGVYRLNSPMIMKRISRDHHEVESYGTVFKTISGVVVPFILSTAIYNLTTVVNQTIYTWISFLQKGLNDIEISTRYGIFSAKAVVISKIPIALSNAMASAVLPTIAAHVEQNDLVQAREKVAKAVKTTMFISIPAAVGIGVLAYPITWLLFPQKASVGMASRLLMLLAVTIVLYSLSTLSNTVLQGIGRVKTPVRNAGIALIIEAAVIAALLYMTNWDLYALVIAEIVYSGCMCILNQMSIRKHLGYKQEIFKTFFVPALSSAVMGVAAYLTYKGIMLLLGAGEFPGMLHTLVALLPAVLVGMILYFVLELVLKGISREELSGIPKGRTLVRLAEKLHLL